MDFHKFRSFELEGYEIDLFLIMNGPNLWQFSFPKGFFVFDDNWLCNTNTILKIG